MAPLSSSVSRISQNNEIFCDRYIPYFSIKRPQHLFQTWRGGLSISLNQQFIWSHHFLRKGYYLFFLAAVLILPLNLKFIIQQIDVWRAYLQFPLLCPAFIRCLVFNWENMMFPRFSILLALQSLKGSKLVCFTLSFLPKFGTLLST